MLIEGYKSFIRVGGRVGLIHQLSCMLRETVNTCQSSLMPKSELCIAIREIASQVLGSLKVSVLAGHRLTRKIKQFPIFVV